MPWRASTLPVRVLVETGEDPRHHSWANGLSYREVLGESRERLPAGERLVTLRDYVDLWLATTCRADSLACNHADRWQRVAVELAPNAPLASFRHPYHSTVLVDTFLDEVEEAPHGQVEATVFSGGRCHGRVVLPGTGKIYEIGPLGLPVRTGSPKTADSETFEHRWWELSSPRILGAGRPVALFANGGTLGCFCELIKAHYFLDERGGYCRVLTLPDEARPAEATRDRPFFGENAK